MSGLHLIHSSEPACWALAPEAASASAAKLPYVTNAGAFPDLAAFFQSGRFFACLAEAGRRFADLDRERHADLLQFTGACWLHVGIADLAIDHYLRSLESTPIGSSRRIEVLVGLCIAAMQARAYRLAVRIAAIAEGEAAAIGAATSEVRLYRTLATLLVLRSTPRIGEHASLTDTLLDAIEAADGLPRRGALHAAMASALLDQRQFDRALQASERATEDARRHGERWQEGISLALSGWILSRLGSAQGSAFLVESEAILAAGEWLGTLVATHEKLAHVAERYGDMATAYASLRAYTAGAAITSSSRMNLALRAAVSALETGTPSASTDAGYPGPDTSPAFDLPSEAIDAIRG